MKNIPRAKYDYIVMGKVAKNSRNKARREIIDLLEADEKHNLLTVTQRLDTITNELINLAKRFTIIEEKLETKQTLSS